MNTCTYDAIFCGVGCEGRVHAARRFAGSVVSAPKGAALANQCYRAAVRRLSRSTALWHWVGSATASLRGEPTQDPDQ